MNTAHPIRLTTLILLLGAAVLLTACGSLVYKQDIQQGNVLDRDKVAQLETGMSKRQVEVLLGSPSIASVFHTDRWDYMNSYSRRGGDPQIRLLTLHFDNGRLMSMEGNYLDSEDLASEALDRLQRPDDTPIQDLDSVRDETRGEGPPG